VKYSTLLALVMQKEVFSIIPPNECPAGTYNHFHKSLSKVGDILPLHKRRQNHQIEQVA